MLRIATDEIHVWLAFPEEAAEAMLLASYWELLSVQERAQQQRFHFARDRHRYLVTRVLVRTILSRYAAVEPSQWLFVNNSYGRPHIANEAADCRDLTFNISHTHGLIVLAITRGRALGVDVENTRERLAPLDLAGHFFAAAEVDALQALPAERQAQRFYEYWTLKESYIKARSMGLSIPLDQFSFAFPGEDEIALYVQPQLGDDASRWRFWQFRPGTGMIAALCVQRNAVAAEVLTFRRVVPLASEAVVEPTLLRASP